MKELEDNRNTVHTESILQQETPQLVEKDSLSASFVCAVPLLTESEYCKSKCSWTLSL